VVLVGTLITATRLLAADINNGLLAYYPLDGSPLDASGNGNNGVVLGAVATSDRFGNEPGAYQFDGASSAIWIGTGVRPEFITVSAWFRTSATTTGGTQGFMTLIRDRLWGYGVGVSGANNVHNAPVGSVDFFVWRSDTEIALLFSSRSTYNDGAWHLATMTYDGLELTTYIDGVLDQSVTSSTASPIYYDQAGGLAIGREGDDTTDYFQGDIDDVRIYNRALSTDEVGQLFGTGTSMPRITVAPSTGGWASANPTSGAPGSTTTLSANPSSGYYFSTWTVNDAGGGSISSTTDKITTFTFGTANAAVTANFTATANVTTLPPTSVWNAGATLNGSVNPNGVPTTAYFQYGPDTGYGNNTGSTDIGTGQSAVPLSFDLSGFTENTVTHYRAVAEAGGELSYGQDQTVTSKPSPLTWASLSLDVYNTTPSGYSGRPAYQLINTFSTADGFDAAAYVTSDKTQVVIAFRGTMLEPTLVAVNNVAADWGFASGRPTSQLHDYFGYAAQFTSTVQQNYPDANLSLTGHSLGGALAQLVGAVSGLTACGFNGPGGKGVLPTLSASLPPITWPKLPVVLNPTINYRIYGDVVSEVPTAFSTVVTIASPYSVPSPKGDPNCDVYAFVGSLRYFLQDHDIHTIIWTLKNNYSQTPGFVGPNFLSSVLSVVHAASEQNNEVGQYIYNVVFQVSQNPCGAAFAFGAGVWLDSAGGIDYLIEDAAHQAVISAIQLPVTDNVKYYGIRSEAGGVWSPFSIAQPGVPVNYDPVAAVEFVPLDSTGNPIAVTNMVCAVFFESAGTYSVNVTQSTNAPFLPPFLDVTPAVNGVTLGWSTNNSSGFFLECTSNLCNPSSWIVISNSPAIVSNRAVIFMPYSNREQLFRLRH